MTCNYLGGVNQDSNQFSVSGQASTQFVRLVWTTAANTILAGAFSAADATTIRNRVETVLEAEFAGANLVFANNPSGGVTKITTLSFHGNSPGTQGGEATYDRLNFVRDNSGVVYIGSGSLNIASSSDPVSSTPLNERRIRNRVADAIARLAAHEIGHMLGLVPIASELTGTLWGDLAICHGVNSLGLMGSPTHHNGSSSSARIMTSTVNLTWSQTWNASLYSFSGTNDNYVERVLQ